MRKLIFFCSLLFSFALTHAQDIDKTWSFSGITTAEGRQVFETNTETDSIVFDKGAFHYHLSAKDNLHASGDYILQNNLLVLFYSTPTDTIRRYKIETLSEKELILSENNVHYAFTDRRDSLTDVIEKEMIPSAGFTVESLWKGVLGMLVLLTLAFLFSNNKKAIRWKTVSIGLSAQILLALAVLKVSFIQKIFEIAGTIFVKILDFTMAGTRFLFKSFVTDQVEPSLITFVITILPTIIFFSALTSVLFYLGIIQRIVKGLAWILTRLMGISGAESLSVAGNIFLGQTEAPLMIKAYLEKMSKSEILLVMVGGMATVAGGVLAAYIGFLGGEDEALKIFYAKHLLTASVMAAPGAIVIAKILYPETQKITNKVEVSQDKIGSNILDAIANGTTEGLKLAANVGAMLLVFIAFIAMINFGFEKAGEIASLNQWIDQNTPYDKFSLEFVLGYLFAPLMWLIGVAREDMALMGQLLGIKLVASEFVGYIQLADLKNTANLISLNYEKSVIMATYMLCGFANFASIGIQIGGIGSLAPGQRKTLSEFGIKALIGGTLASLLSATIAGMIIG
jgi:CNT family concentrative nucleoside transporter